MGMLSFAFMPFFHGPLREITGDVRWLAPGALLLATNNAAFAFTLAQWTKRRRPTSCTARAVSGASCSCGSWALVGNLERHAAGSDALTTGGSGADGRGDHARGDVTFKTSIDLGRKGGPAITLNAGPSFFFPALQPVHLPKTLLWAG